MNNRKGILLALALVSSGAASAKDLRDRKPAIEQATAKSLTQVQECLAERWVQTIDFPVGTVPMKNGIIYNARSHMTGFVMTVEVSDQGEHRLVRAWTKASPMSFVRVKDHLAKVRGCA